MDELCELVAKYPSRLGRVPAAMETLFSRTPDVTYEFENMHKYFTFSDEKLEVKMMIGMSLLPCITSYTFGGETVNLTLYISNHEKFDGMISYLCRKIYNVSDSSINTD